MVNGEDAITDYLVNYLEADSELMGMTSGEVAPHASWGSNASPFVRLDRLEAST